MERVVSFVVLLNHEGVSHRCPNRMESNKEMTNWPKVPGVCVFTRDPLPACGALVVKELVCRSEGGHFGASARVLVEDPVEQDQFPAEKMCSRIYLCLAGTEFEDQGGGFPGRGGPDG